MNTHEFADALEAGSAAHHVGHDYSPDAGSLLSRRQKWRLVQLSRKAWIANGCPGCEHDFRHAEAITACGLRVSEASQRQWAALKAHFENIAGSPDRAINTLIRENDNARRVALYKLKESCRLRGLNLAYANAICRRQNRCDLDDANAAQLWRLNFTVCNRRKPR